MRAALLGFAGIASAGGQQISGELKQWHNVVLTFDGPSTSESAESNPFFSYRPNVTFTNGRTRYVVPGYFAAGGNPAEMSAKHGNERCVHFVPDAIGTYDGLTQGTEDWLFAKRGEVYAIHLPEGGKTELDLTNAIGPFEVKWYNARNAELQHVTIRTVQGGGRQKLGEAPQDKNKDWAVLARRAASTLRRNQ